MEITGEAGAKGKETAESVAGRRSKVITPLSFRSSLNKGEKRASRPLLSDGTLSNDEQDGAGGGGGVRVSNTSESTSKWKRWRILGVSDEEQVNTPLKLE